MLDIFYDLAKQAVVLRIRFRLDSRGPVGIVFDIESKVAGFKELDEHAWSTSNIQCAFSRTTTTNGFF